MDTPISSATPGSDNAATSTQTPASTNGTAPTNGDARQSAPVEEGFTKVDPNTLPPQLREAYNNMLRDYKDKTTKVSETVKAQLAKELEPYRTKAQTYDQIIQRKEFVEKWNAYVEEENRKSQQQNVDPNDPNAKLLQEVEQMKKVQAETQMEIRTAKALDTLNAFAEAVNEKGEKLHPDFDKLAGYSLGQHQNAGNYDLLRTAIELASGNSPQEKLDNGYKAAKAVHDAIFEEGKKAGMGRLQDKVRNATTPPSTVAPSKFVNERPKDMLEALEWAKKGIAVQR